MPCSPKIAAVAALAVCVPAVPAAARDLPGAPGKLTRELRAIAAADDPRRAGERRDVVVTRGERVLVDVDLRVASGRALGALRSAGMDVAASSDRAPVPVAEGHVPVDRLDDLAALDEVQAVRPVVAYGTDTGSVLSQGDAAHRGPQARALGAGIDGSGVKVGVISDSIDQVGTKLAGSVSRGDLPAGMQVLLDDTTNVIDEGRAMAEIIYDTAPGIAGSDFLFSSGTTAGPVEKANSVTALRNAGAKVIADDIFYNSEPFFQDGVIAQAVDAAKAAGVMYFASAGNRARQSWEGTMNAGVGARHAFAAGDTRQTVASVPNGAWIEVVLQWDEPWGKATDIDIDASFVVDGAVVATSDSNNVTTRTPYERLFWQNTTGTPKQVELELLRFAGTRQPFMKYIARGNFGTFTIAEHPTNSDAINADAAAANGSWAVAAIHHAEPGLDDPESFSSRGLKTRLFDKDGTRLAQPDVRQKPDLAGLDGVSTGTEGFSTFFGTSAATPSLAAIAVLVRDANPSLSPDQVGAILEDADVTNDCTLAGFPDADCGFGLSLADAAVSKALGLPQDTTPPVITGATSPATPGGRGAWHTARDVTVSWTVSDAESAVTSPACPSASIPEGTHVRTCSATSAGGSSTASVTVHHDSVPPAAPTITQIAAGATYTEGSVPAVPAECSSRDDTSGLAGCTVAGYSAAVGSHTLTLTATDVAGLTSVSHVPYKVAARPQAPAPPAPPVAPPAQDQIVVPPPLAPVLKSPVSRLRTTATRLRSLRAGRWTTSVTCSRTCRLRVTVVDGRRVVASASRTLRRRGTARIKPKLTKAGRTALRRTRRKRLKVVVRAVDARGRTVGAPRTRTVTFR